MRNSVVLVKLTDRSVCDDKARQSSWRLDATLPAERSHEQLTPTEEMTALGDYSKVSVWPPKAAESCCQVIPEIKCVDRVCNFDSNNSTVLLLLLNALAALLELSVVGHALGCRGSICDNVGPQPDATHLVQRFQGLQASTGTL